MLAFKKIILSCALFLTFSPLTSYSYNVDMPVEEIIRNANLMKLINTERCVNLVAQMKNPDESTDVINNFNDFIAIGVSKKPRIHTNMANFDKDQTIIKKVTRNLPWIGVREYSQSEIPSISLQTGLSAVQACMAQKQQPILSNQVSRVVIYKTINTSEIIYDYAFRIDSFAKGICQEYLYAPISNTCSRGMATSCHMTLPDSL